MAAESFPSLAEESPKVALGREAGAGCFLSLTTKLHRVRFSRGKMQLWTRSQPVAKKRSKKGCA